jgi:glucosylceramidase
MNHSLKFLFLAAGLVVANLTGSCIADEMVSGGKASSVTITAPAKLLANASQALVWKATVPGTTGDTIKVDGSKKFQTVLGFGGAFTDASCYTFNEMPAEARKKLFHELFASDELGLNVCRTCIGSSDYSTAVYSYDEGEPDPELKRFSIDFDRKYILPMLREAMHANPDLFLFSTPWSPPGWMKSGKSMLGGTMHRQYLPAYANYFVKFVQAYAAEGVPIPAVTIQNEVDTDQDGRMPACSWPQEIEADFAALHLGPALEKAGLKTQIWLVDHNYNLWGRAICELESPEVRKYATGIAWHGYLGEPDRMTRVHDAYPDTNMYWTEGGPDFTDKAYRTDWTKWGRTFTGIFRNWCRSVTAWNIALDENGKPNLGPFPCGGIVTVNSKTKEVTRSGQYYALAQFSKFIKRGAYRIQSEGDVSDIAHVAFENPDGQRVLVVTNSGASRPIRICAADKETTLNLDADSITTLTW